MVNLQVVTRFKLLLLFILLPAVILLFNVFQQPFVDFNVLDKSNHLPTKIHFDNGKSIDFTKNIFPNSAKQRRELYKNKSDYLSANNELYQLFSKTQQIQVEFTNGKKQTLEVTHQRGVKSTSKEFWIILSLAIFVILCALMLWIWQTTSKPILYSMLGGVCLFYLMLISAIQTLNVKIFHPLTMFILNIGFGFSQILFLLFTLLTLASFPQNLIKNLAIRRVIYLFVACVFILSAIKNISIPIHIDQIFIQDFWIYTWITVAYLVGIALCVKQIKKAKNNLELRKQSQAIALIWVIFPTIFMLLKVVPFFIDDSYSLDRVWSYVLVVGIYLMLLLMIVKVNLFSSKTHLQTSFVLLAFWLAIALGDIMFAYLLNFISHWVLFIPLIWLYFPIRSTLRKYLNSKHHQNYQQSFNQAITVLNKNATDINNKLWKKILQKIFLPLTIKTQSHDTDYHLSADKLIIKNNNFSKALILEHPQNGARIFNQYDLYLVKNLANLLNTLLEQQNAFLQGQNKERKRISQDLHDQIGHSLLSLVYTAKDHDSKHLAQKTIIQLGEIINTLNKKNTTVNDLFDEIYTISNLHLKQTNILLEFQKTNTSNNLISHNIYSNTLNIMRELLSNAVKYSKSSKINIEISVKNAQLEIIFTDNGIGFNANKTTKNGNGIRNINHRIQEMSGDILWGSSIVIRIDYAN